MKIRTVAISLFAVLAAAYGTCSIAGEPIPVTLQAYFSPNEGAEQVLIDQINNAKKSVKMQAYIFTAPPIAKALIDAHNKGVKVEVLVDKKMKTAPKSLTKMVSDAGVPLLFDVVHRTAHNKIILIDGNKIITGSYNFAKDIDIKNAENFLIINSKPVYEQYNAQWEKHKEHSQPETVNQTLP